MLLLIRAGLFECDLEGGVLFIDFALFGAETLVFRCRAAHLLSDHWVYVVSFLQTLSLGATGRKAPISCFGALGCPDSMESMFLLRLGVRMRFCCLF